MKEIVYVNGGVVIQTPFFRYLDAGAQFGMPSEINDIIEPDEEIEGQPCLIITEEKAPSFFKGYYAKTFFSTKFEIASFFSSSIEDCFSDFENRIFDVRNLIKQNDVSKETRQVLYQLSLVAAVAALDTYLSDLVLFVSTKDRKTFLNTAQKFCQNKAANIVARIARMWSDNILDSAEQEVIDFVLKTSFSNIKRINDDILKDLYGLKNLPSFSIDDIFRLRHIIVHRSGKQKNGEEICFNKDELLSKIGRLESVALTINNLVKNSEIVKSLKHSKY